MLAFPGEESRSSRIQEVLGNQLDFAERLLDFWASENDEDEWFGNAEVEDLVINLAMGIDLQSCRLFRSVIEECRRGEGIAGDILLRSLYESILGLLFILKPEVTISVVPALSRKTKERRADSDGTYKYRAKLPSTKDSIGDQMKLSRYQRACMYLGHPVFKNQKFLDRSDNCGLDVLTSKDRESIDSNSKEYAQELGSIWTAVLRDSDKYSGLSVHDLSKLLDENMHQWYLRLYGFHSRTVHAADAARLFVPTSEGTRMLDYFSSDRRLMQILGHGCALFMAAVRILHDNIDFGGATGETLDRFDKEFSEVYIDQSATVCEDRKL